MNIWSTFETVSAKDRDLKRSVQHLANETECYRVNSLPEICVCKCFLVFLQTCETIGNIICVCRTIYGFKRTLGRKNILYKTAMVHWYLFSHEILVVVMTVWLTRNMTIKACG